MVSIPICQVETSVPGRIPYKNIKGAYHFSAARYADFRGDYVNLDPAMAAIEAGTNDRSWVDRALKERGCALPES